MPIQSARGGSKPRKRLSTALLAACLAASPAVADTTAVFQPAAREMRWETRGGWERRESRPAKNSIDRTALSLRRSLGSGSVAADFVAERRETWASAVAVDAYRDLWAGAYGNARLLAALDGRYIERSDLLVELFQAAARRWELAGLVRLADYRVERVLFLGAGLGAYVPRWYLRSQILLAFPEAGAAGSWANSVRRYFRGDDFLEARADLGRAIDPARFRSEGGFGMALSGGGQYFVVPVMGAALGAGWEARGGERTTTVRASLIGRW